MTNINDSKLLHCGEEQKDAKRVKSFIIITSVDDGNDEVLSGLNSSNVETFFANLNDTGLIDKHQLNNLMNNSNKRLLSQYEREISVDESKTKYTKKRKADLTCVVCGGQAIGYNFDQITCESCKAFFRRNAVQPLEKVKCIKHNNHSNEVQCNVGYGVKHKCQRCRLLKCFQAGMRKDFILTSEEKQLKKQRLEQNRELSSGLIKDHKHNIKNQIADESLKNNQDDSSFIEIHSDSSTSLTEDDWSCLSYIQNSYISASQSAPSASSVMSFDLAPDKMSAFMYTIDMQHFTAIKLINFLRKIPEFRQLDEQDRVILVKYNLTLLFLMRNALNFDSAREICYDLDTSGPVSPNDEAFAHYCKSLFILCYGYEFSRAAISIFRVVANIINKDPIINQLLMLIMIFSKGLSADDEQEPTLNDEKSVFYAQSKYTNLLFRYLLQQYSFEVVAIKMTRITEQLLKMQKVSRDFQLYIKSKVDLTHINPLMKCLLHLT